jgi:fructokinase
VSEEDLEWIGPLPSGGPAVTLVTRGAAGATVVPARGEPVEVPSPRVEVVDTIGAGDAFGGGFLAWWQARGLGPGDLIDTELVVEGTRFAVRVAALTCARAGASPPRPDELGATGS